MDELKGKQKERVLEDREQAFFSRELVTIKTDVELDVTPAECVRKDFVEADLVAALTRFAFHSLLEELAPGAGLVEEVQCSPSAHLRAERQALLETVGILEASLLEL